MAGLRGMRWRKVQVSHLEQHPNLNEILGVLAQLPHVGDGDIPTLARAWRNTAYIADARAKALAPDSPLVIEVLACFEAVVALFHDDLAGEAPYVTVPVPVTMTALKAVRDAIAAAYARPVLAQGEYLSLMRPWRETYPFQNFDEPDLGPHAEQVKAVLATMPMLSQRCHDGAGRALFDSLARTATTLDSGLRGTARDEAWQAAVLTSRRRVWAMVRRSGIEAMGRVCPDCGTQEESGLETAVLELCLDAACGLIVADAIDENLTEVLTLPLAQLIPTQRPAPEGA